MKRIAVIISALILSAVLFSACTDNNDIKTPANDVQSDNTSTVEAEKLTEEETNAYKSLYLEKIAELNLRHEGIEWTYSLADIDGDNIPELIACYPATVSLYTYADGEIHTVMDEVGYGFAGNNGYSYLPGKNVIFNTNYDMAGAVVYENYCKIDENYDLKNYYSKPLYTSLWKDVNGNGMPEDNEIGDSFSYYYGNEELTEEAYNEYRFGDESDFELLYGEMSYDEIFAELNK